MDDKGEVKRMDSDTYTTTWRSRGVAPVFYDDARALCAQARQARNGVAEFDWHFARDELLCLREALRTRGRTVVGRFTRTMHSRATATATSAWVRRARGLRRAEAFSASRRPEATTLGRWRRPWSPT
jgi:hypothetical protein